MLIQRRSVRYCKSPKCNKLLVRREGESAAKFLLRKYCNTTCSADTKRDSPNQCFCGKPWETQNAPFCCWDHRLIANKCKQWRIEPSIKDYEEKSRILNLQQREVDMKCRHNPDVYLA